MITRTKLGIRARTEPVIRDFSPIITEYVTIKVFFRKHKDCRIIFLSILYYKLIASLMSFIPSIIPDCQ